MRKTDLTEDEISLLKKLGLSPDTLFQEKLKRGKPEAPPLTDLGIYSGEMVLHCRCCGNEETRLFDYVKRADAPGYTIRTVKKPTNKISRHHKSTVVSCSFCHNGKLSKFEKDHLLQMVLNLRDYIRRG
jgi:hypothetical protein